MTTLHGLLTERIQDYKLAAVDLRRSRRRGAPSFGVPVCGVRVVVHGGSGHILEISRDYPTIKALSAHE